MFEISKLWNSTKLAIRWKQSCTNFLEALNQHLLETVLSTCWAVNKTISKQSNEELKRESEQEKQNPILEVLRLLLILSPLFSLQHLQTFFLSSAFYDFWEVNEKHKKSRKRFYNKPSSVYFRLFMVSSFSILWNYHP